MPVDQPTPSKTPTRDGLARRDRELRKCFGLSADVRTASIVSYSSLNDEFVFGVIWSRPGLPLNERMMSVPCARGALERHALIQDYVAATLRLDVTPRAIQELFMQASLYAGFATVESACRLAQEVLDAKGVAAADAPGAEVSAVLDS